MSVHRDYPQLGKFMEHMRRSGYEVAEVNEVNDGETGLIDYELRVQIRETTRRNRWRPSSVR